MGRGEGPLDEGKRGTVQGARGRGRFAASMVQQELIRDPLSKLIVIYHANCSSGDQPGAPALGHNCNSTQYTHSCPGSCIHVCKRSTTT
jgi:hypothetical protein